MHFDRAVREIHSHEETTRVELRRIDRLPPYVFSIVNDMKAEARRRGEDIIDLGMGNPDLPTPQPIVDKLTQAAQNSRNHRYSASRGIAKLRLALSDWYDRRFDVEIDPEREALVSIGAKEGLAHLMWVLLRSGDTALVPEPSYPIHQFSCIFAGAEVNSVPLTHDTADFFADLTQAYERTWPRPRVVLVSFPHNPTGHCEDLILAREVHQALEEIELHAVACGAVREAHEDDARPRPGALVGLGKVGEEVGRVMRERHAVHLGPGEDAAELVDRVRRLGHKGGVARAQEHPHQVGETLLGADGDELSL